MSITTLSRVCTYQSRIDARDKAYKLCIALCKLLIWKLADKKSDDPSAALVVERARKVLSSFDSAREVWRLGKWVDGLYKALTFSSTGGVRDLPLPEAVATFTSILAVTCYALLSNARWASKTIAPQLDGPAIARKERQCMSLVNACLLYVDMIKWQDLLATRARTATPTLVDQRIVAHAKVTAVHLCDFLVEMQWVDGWPVGQGSMSALSLVSACLSIQSIWSKC
eukprot:TRINITY_DN34975_c0_g1_i1.p2 TRINITY_DN34975_c0_g1~~TRINITY_DN34975_c0_g1_i1.p2  ORF type:complete len:254 (-),score=21.58 TRINITY_DN34975_c0_g1_i1:324-1001(-)